MACVKKTSDGGLRFQCPGCNMSHVVGINMPDKARWSWNGDMDKPTLNPSVCVTWSEPSNNPEEFDDVNKDIHHRCHSFVRDGRIQYLDDCTHGMKGHTVDLPLIEE